MVDANDAKMNVKIYQLTESEEALIDKHLTFYRELAAGERKPATEAQKHFVLVCYGRARAETEHEFAYAKYLRIQAYNRPNQAKISDCIPKYEEGFPHLGWSDERDWKQMKKGNYADMKKRGRDG